MSRSWIEVPTNVYVIEHRDDLVLFDAGLDPVIGPDDTLTKKLEGLGYSAADVRKVIVSHLHFDHVGCIANVPQAELLVSRDEWRQLSGPHPERDFIFREHIELPSAKWCQIDFAPTSDPLFAPFGGCFDVMGDGSMTLLPTPGHTPGSTSMLVRTDGLPPLLLVGDLTYEVGLLMKDQVPGTGDKTQLRSSFAKVRTLKMQLPDLVILPAHDPAATEALRAATQPIDVATKRKFSSNNGSDSTTRNDGTVL